MSSRKLKVTLVGASILRESELPGFEAISDFASESYNLAIASIKASVQARPELADRVDIVLADFDVSWDRKNLGPEDAKRICNEMPDVVGLSCYCWSLDTLLDLARRVRERLPRVLIVLGGPSAGPDAETLLQRCPAIDAVVRGEGEDSFASLLLARLDDAPFTSVPGLAWRTNDGTIAVNELPEHPVDLDTLPSPYRSGVMRPTGSSLFLETSRGCRFRCKFCSWMGGGKRLRYVPIEQVEADLRWALDNDVRSVKLADTAINFHTQRLEQLTSALDRVDPDRKLRFTYFLKPELLTEEQVSLLERIPSNEIIIGIESLNAVARKSAGKPPFDPAAFEQHMRWLSRVGPVTASFILGLPGDTADGLDHTLDWMIRFDERHPDWLHVICLFWLAVLPGASLHTHRDALGLRVMPNETPYALESKAHTPDDLLVMARRSIERHYAHPKVRVEYFHKEYLMQDAPEEDRKVSIPRRSADTRPVVFFAGEGDPSWETMFRLRPYSLPAAWAKAYVETNDRMRSRWRFELVNVRDPVEALTAMAGPNVAHLFWFVRARPSPEMVRAMQQLPSGSKVVLVGASSGPQAHAWLEYVSHADAVIVGEPERTLGRLLDGEQEIRGLVLRGVEAHGPGDQVDVLDEIPSPFQWGLVQRPGPTIAMQLGRPGDRMRVHSPERIYSDLRWAIEQRHEHIVWLDSTLPTDRAALQGFVDAVRRADPGRKLRHTYRIGGGHSKETVAVFAELPVQTVLLATSDDGVRAEVGRWKTRVVDELQRLVDALDPLRRPGALLGWTLRSIQTEEDKVLAEVGWQRTTVRVRLRYDMADARQVQASLDVGEGREPPREELDRLARAVTRLLGRLR